MAPRKDIGYRLFINIPLDFELSIQYKPCRFGTDVFDITAKILSNIAYFDTINHKITSILFMRFSTLPQLGQHRNNIFFFFLNQHGFGM